MKIFSPLPILFLLLSVTLAAQPRVQEERPLPRAVSEAARLIRDGSYVDAAAGLQSALDSVAPGENIADALYLLTRAEFMLGHYRAAYAGSRSFLASYPFDARREEMRYLEGTAAYQEGLRGEAAEAFREVAAGAGADHRNALYWVARIAADSNRLDEAERYAGESLTGDRFEFTDPALYLKAWIMEGRGELDSAALLYRKLIDSDPGGDLLLDAQLRLGVIDARRGNNESALRLLTSITPRSERQTEEQLFYLGEISSALGRYDDALRYNNEFLRTFPKSPRVRSARYGVGWAELQLGKYPESVATFRLLEDGIDSIAAAASYQIGAIQVKQGDTAGAFKTFESLVAKLPYESFSDNAYYQLGRIFYRRQQYDSARHYLLIAARQFPESDVRPDAYYLLGESYAALNDAGNAQYAFARAQKIGATGELYRRALYREGVMLYKVGRFHSAVDRFREYVSEQQKGEQIADATFWLGEALYQDHAYDEAERYYAMYVERFASGRWREESLYGLAWSNFQQKEFRKAALAFSGFIENNPKSDLAVEATLRLADSYRFLGEYAKAIETYESVGGLSGKGARDEEAQIHIAEALLQLREVDRAVEVFRKLIASYPTSPRRDGYGFNIGSIYQGNNRDSLAIAEFMAFPDRYPESKLLPQVAFALGDIYYNNESYDSALVYYRRVLDDYPNSTVVPPALDAVRFTLNAMGRGQEAVAIIDSFQVRNPNRIPPDSLDFRKAGIVLEGGDFPGAILLYNRIAEQYPNSPVVPDAIYQVARGYEYLGNRDSAALYYRRVVDGYPASAAAPNAQVEEANLMLRAGQWSEAANSYEQYLTKYADRERDNEAHYGIAQARLALRDTLGALEEFRMVLDSSRGKEDDLFLDKSRVATARLIAPRGEIDRSLDLLAAVVNRRLDDIAAEALLLRGELLIKNNDLSAALVELRRFTTDFASYTEYAEPGLMKLGGVYEQLTNYAAARDIYTQLSTQSENAAVKKEAEARLKKLKK
ncbi:MAG: tetratricopeptide repeat protein [Candidatus Kapaibacterium sp.]